jgi:hypothetical protein
VGSRRETVRSRAETVCAELISLSYEPHSTVASPRASDRSTKTALDAARSASIIDIEQRAVAVTAAIWEIPDSGM